jgi:SAM-dependent methyltransferase
VTAGHSAATGASSPDAEQLGVLARRPLRLELGCGSTKRDPEAVGIDLIPADGVDLVVDAYVVLEQLPDGSVDSIHSEHFLEHILDLERLLRESARVLRPQGRFTARVPHFSSPYYYSDPTHRSPFGLYTFGYFLRSTPLRRAVPQYSDPLPFTLSTPVLVFKSPRPFYGRYVFKRALGALVNLNRWGLEFWEENLCWLLPCYEITYELRRE